VGVLGGGGDRREMGCGINRRVRLIVMKDESENILFLRGQYLLPK
jgi:hypothetical protein